MAGQQSTRPNHEIGRRLQQAREAAGLTQGRAAGLAGLSTGVNMSRVEAGQCLTLQTVAKLCRLYGVSLDAVVWGKQ